MINQNMLACAILVTTLCFSAQTVQAQEAKQGVFLVSLDSLILPFESDYLDSAGLLGLSGGGNYYFNHYVAVHGAIGIMLIKDNTHYYQGRQTDIELEPYVRANVKFGDFSKPYYSLYGMIGIEPYTAKFEGQLPDKSVGGIAFGAGLTLGNARMGLSGMGVELMTIQEPDLGDNIERISIYFEF